MKFKQHKLVLIIKKKCFSKFWCQRNERGRKWCFGGAPFPPGWRAVMQLSSGRAAQVWSMGAFPQGCWARREYGHRKPVLLLFLPEELSDFFVPIGGLDGKNLLSMWETQVRSLGREDLLEKEMATHSSILAWRIPWTEEPGRLQATASQRVRHDSTTTALTTLPTHPLPSLKWVNYLREPGAKCTDQCPRKH